MPPYTMVEQIIVAVTLQQIDHPPNAKTTAKRDDKGLKNIDRRIKKLHIKTLPGTEEYVQTTLPFSGAPFKFHFNRGRFVDGVLYI